MTHDRELPDGNGLHRVEPSEVVPGRAELVIDLDEGTVSAGPWSAAVPSDGTDPDEVLTRYLALLYEMRDLDPGTPIPLRSLDVSVLSRALTLPALDVEQRLQVLMTPDDGRVERMRRLLSRRLLVPAAGVVVAATAAGVLVLLPGTSPADGATIGADLGRVTGGSVATALSVPDADLAGAVGNARPAVPVEVDGIADAPPGPDAATAPDVPAPDPATDPDPATESDPITDPQAAPPGADTPEIGEGLTVENADPQVAPPGADVPEIGDALTVEAP